MNNKNENELILDAAISIVVNRYFEGMDVVSAEGVQLKEYPVPKKLLRRAKREYKLRNRRVSPGITFLKRAAVVFLATVSLTFAIVLTDSGVRGAVYNNLFKIFSNRREIHYEWMQSEEGPKNVKTIEPGYIPDGFELIEKHYEEGLLTKYYYEYKSIKDKYLFISFCNPENVTTGVGGDYFTFEETEVNGFLAFLAEENIELTGDDPVFSLRDILFGNKFFIVRITGMVSRDDLVKIAENIKIIEY